MHRLRGTECIASQTDKDASEGHVPRRAAPPCTGSRRATPPRVQTEEEKNANVSFGRLLGLVAAYWPHLLLGIAASAALGGVMPLFATLLSELIVALDATEPRSTAVRFALGFFALGGGVLAVSALQGWAFGAVGANLAEDVRQMFLCAALYMEIGWFDREENGSGALAARLASDAPSVRGAVSDVMGLIIQNLVTVVLGFAIAFANSWRMTLLIMGVLPLVAGASIVQVKLFAGVLPWPLAAAQPLLCQRLPAPPLLCQRRPQRDAACAHGFAGPRPVALLPCTCTIPVRAACSPTIGAAVQA